MKRILALLLALCLCIGLCACGGTDSPEPTANATELTENTTTPSKSVEAQKADELILAIGEVNLDSEAAILAAQAYYDSLTDEQKDEVDNVDVLDAAVNTLNELKKEVEYKEIYTSAQEKETNLSIDEAYAEYGKLPADYEDVAQRMEALKPLVGITGHWICENKIATSNKGVELGASAQTYLY